MDKGKIRELLSSEIIKTGEQVVRYTDLAQPYHRTMLLEEFLEWMLSIIKVLLMQHCERPKNV